MYDDIELCTMAARTLGYEDAQIVATMTGAIPDGASEFGTLCVVEVTFGRLVDIFLPDDGGPASEIDNDANP